MAKNDFWSWPNVEDLVKNAHEYKDTKPINEPTKKASKNDKKIKDVISNTHKSSQEIDNPEKSISKEDQIIHDVLDKNSKTVKEILEPVKSSKKESLSIFSENDTKGKSSTQIDTNITPSSKDQIDINTHLKSDNKDSIQIEETEHSQKIDVKTNTTTHSKKIENSIFDKIEHKNKEENNAENVNVDINKTETKIDSTSSVSKEETIINNKNVDSSKLEVSVENKFSSNNKSEKEINNNSKSSIKTETTIKSVDLLEKEEVSIANKFVTDKKEETNINSKSSSITKEETKITESQKSSKKVENELSINKGKSQIKEESLISTIFSTREKEISEQSVDVNVKKVKKIEQAIEDGTYEEKSEKEIVDNYITTSKTETDIPNSEYEKKIETNIASTKSVSKTETQIESTEPTYKEEIKIKNVEETSKTEQEIVDNSITPSKTETDIPKPTEVSKQDATIDTTSVVGVSDSNIKINTNVKFPISTPTSGQITENNYKTSSQMRNKDEADSSTKGNLKYTIATLDNSTTENGENKISSTPEISIIDSKENKTQSNENFSYTYNTPMSGIEVEEGYKKNSNLRNKDTSSTYSSVINQDRPKSIDKNSDYSSIKQDSDRDNVLGDFSDVIIPIDRKNVLGDFTDIITPEDKNVVESGYTVSDQLRNKVKTSSSQSMLDSSNSDFTESLTKNYSYSLNTETSKYKQWDGIDNVSFAHGLDYEYVKNVDGKRNIKEIKNSLITSRGQQQDSNFTYYNYSDPTNDFRDPSDRKNVLGDFTDIITPDEMNPFDSGYEQNAGYDVTKSIRNKYETTSQKSTIGLSNSKYKDASTNNNFVYEIDSLRDIKTDKFIELNGISSQSTITSNVILKTNGLTNILEMTYNPDIERFATKLFDSSNINYQFSSNFNYSNISVASTRSSKNWNIVGDKGDDYNSLIDSGFKYVYDRTDSIIEKENVVDFYGPGKKLHQQNKNFTYDVDVNMNIKTFMDPLKQQDDENNITTTMKSGYKYIYDGSNSDGTSNNRIETGVIKYKASVLNNTDQISQQGTNFVYFDSNPNFIRNLIVSKKDNSTKKWNIVYDDKDLYQEFRPEYDFDKELLLDNGRLDSTVNYTKSYNNTVKQQNTNFSYSVTIDTNKVKTYYDNKYVDENKNKIELSTFIHTYNYSNNPSLIDNSVNKEISTQQRMNFNYSDTISRNVELDKFIALDMLISQKEINRVYNPNNIPDDTSITRLPSIIHGIHGVSNELISTYNPDTSRFVSMSTNDKKYQWTTNFDYGYINVAKIRSSKIWKTSKDDAINSGIDIGYDYLYIKNSNTPRVINTIQSSLDESNGKQQNTNFSYSQDIIKTGVKSYLSDQKDNSGKYIVESSFVDNYNYVIDPNKHQQQRENFNYKIEVLTDNSIKKWSVTSDDVDTFDANRPIYDFDSELTVETGLLNSSINYIKTGNNFVKQQNTNFSYSEKIITDNVKTYIASTTVDTITKKEVEVIESTFVDNSGFVYASKPNDKQQQRKNFKYNQIINKDGVKSYINGTITETTFVNNYDYSVDPNDKQQQRKNFKYDVSTNFGHAKKYFEAYSLDPISTYTGLTQGNIKSSVESNKILTGKIISIDQYNSLSDQETKNKYVLIKTIDGEKYYEIASNKALYSHVVDATNNIYNTSTIVDIGSNPVSTLDDTGYLIQNSSNKYVVGVKEGHINQEYVNFNYESGFTDHIVSRKAGETKDEIYQSMAMSVLSSDATVDALESALSIIPAISNLIYPDGRKDIREPVWNADLLKIANDGVRVVRDTISDGISRQPKYITPFDGAPRSISNKASDTEKKKWREYNRPRYIVKGNTSAELISNIIITYLAPAAINNISSSFFGANPWVCELLKTTLGTISHFDNWNQVKNLFNNDPGFRALGVDTGAVDKVMDQFSSKMKSDSSPSEFLDFNNAFLKRTIRFLNSELPRMLATGSQNASYESAGDDLKDQYTLYGTHLLLDPRNNEYYRMQGHIKQEGLHYNNGSIETSMAQTFASFGDYIKAYKNNLYNDLGLFDGRYASSKEGFSYNNDDYIQHDVLSTSNLDTKLEGMIKHDYLFNLEKVIDQQFKGIAGKANKQKDDFRTKALITSNVMASLSPMQWDFKLQNNKIKSEAVNDRYSINSTRSDFYNYDSNYLKYLGFITSTVNTTQSSGKTSSSSNNTNSLLSSVGLNGSSNPGLPQRTRTNESRIKDEFLTSVAKSLFDANKVSDIKNNNLIYSFDTMSKEDGDINNSNINLLSNDFIWIGDTTKQSYSSKEISNRRILSFTEEEFRANSISNVVFNGFKDEQNRYQYLFNVSKQREVVDGSYKESKSGTTSSSITDPLQSEAKGNITFNIGKNTPIVFSSANEGSYSLNNIVPGYFDINSTHSEFKMGANDSQDVTLENILNSNTRKSMTKNKAGFYILSNKYKNFMMSGDENYDLTGCGYLYGVRHVANNGGSNAAHADNGQFSRLVIPFQFDADIVSIDRQSNWNQVNAFGRSSDWYIWSNSSSKAATLKTTYAIVSPDNDFKTGFGYNLNGDSEENMKIGNGNYDNMKYFTERYILALLAKYDTLMVPFSAGYSPPIIKIRRGPMEWSFSRKGGYHETSWIVTDLSVEERSQDAGFTMSRTARLFDVSLTLKEVFLSWDDFASGWAMTQDGSGKDSISGRGDESKVALHNYKASYQDMTNKFAESNKLGNNFPGLIKTRLEDTTTIRDSKDRTIYKK